MSLFTTEREKRIVRSGVRKVFTPHAPVQAKDLLAGRDVEIGRLLEIINTPGQHALLYGDRGVGKSSLAYVAGIILGVIEMRGDHWLKRCDSRDTFASIVAEPLRAAGFDIDLQSVTESHVQGGKAGAGLGGFKGGVHSERQKGATRRPVAENASSPSWVAVQLSGLKGVFLVDEADAISSNEDRRLLAELIKHLSDSNASFKVLVVGIAETESELTGGHASVGRCLKEVKLKRMPEKELRRIVEIGAKTVNLRFDEGVTKTIVELSSGYPHFTHLLALKCAEDAIAEGRVLITERDLERALERAVSDAEASLLRAYQAAITSASTDNYQKVLCAAACCPGPKFSNKEWREKLEQMYGIRIKPQALNNYLARLASDNGSAILRRVARGVYRFNDPRMPSFIKIAERLHKK